MSASRSSSVRVPAWNCPEMDWTIRVSGLSLKDWRACYAEHNRIEQILLHPELYGHALQVQQSPCSYPTSAWKGAAERRSVHRDVKEPQACPSVLVRQDLFQSLLKFSVWPMTSANFMTGLSRQMLLHPSATSPNASIIVIRRCPLRRS